MITVGVKGELTAVAVSSASQTQIEGMVIKLNNFHFDVFAALA